jgi:hypothetical protein
LEVLLIKRRSLIEVNYDGFKDIWSQPGNNTDLFL